LFGPIIVMNGVLFRFRLGVKKIEIPAQQYTVSEHPEATLIDGSGVEMNKQ